jgi:hypothetical protein
MFDKAKIRVVKNTKNIKIYISNSLHLSVKTNEFIGLQSWIDDDYFVIQYYFSDGTTITSEYDIQAKWEAILQQLDSVLNN